MGDSAWVGARPDLQQLRNMTYDEGRIRDQLEKRLESLTETTLNFLTEVHLDSTEEPSPKEPALLQNSKRLLNPVHRERGGKQKRGPLPFPPHVIVSHRSPGLPSEKLMFSPQSYC